MLCDENQYARAHGDGESYTKRAKNRGEASKRTKWRLRVANRQPREASENPIPYPFA